MKNMLHLLDKNFSRSKEYTDNKQNDFDELLKVRLKELNEKNMEIRSIVYSNQSKINEEIENFAKEKEKIYV